MSEIGEADPTVWKRIGMLALVAGALFGACWTVLHWLFGAFGG